MTQRRLDDSEIRRKAGRTVELVGEFTDRLEVSAGRTRMDVIMTSVDLCLSVPAASKTSTPPVAL